MEQQREEAKRMVLRALHLDEEGYGAMVRKFVAANTNLERMDLVYSHKHDNDSFLTFVEDKKDKVAAKKARTQAKRFYHGQRYIDAQRSYTKALALADTPIGKAEAYANRSAALFKLRLYRECITDCDRAITVGYPAAFMPILIARKQQALMGASKQNSKYYEEVPTIPETNRNASLRCASDSIEIEKNETFGKHVVATRDIEIGEVLVVEKPYASFLIDSVTNHCHHCLELCYTLVPCDNCTWALFCNEECKREAIEAYHTYECQIAATLKKINCFHSRLTTRIILKGFRELLQEGRKMAGDKNNRSDKFKEILQFEHCMDKLSVDELLIVCVAACEVYHLVKTHTNFLRTSVEHEMFKDVISTMGHVQLINAMVTREKWKRKNQYVAVALYPGATAFNHSCRNNVTSVFYGEVLVLRACRTIRRGDQCFITYGTRAAEDYILDRKHELQELYHFECECRACEEEWPMISSSYSPLEELNVWDEFNLKSNVIRNFGADEVEEIMSDFKKMLKKNEHLEPDSIVYYLETVVCECMAFFGNKRKI